MPSTSHARCRRCGKVRHKIARRNLCRLCWLAEKSSVTEKWRAIKARRAQRRAIAESFESLETVMIETNDDQPAPKTAADFFTMIRTGTLPAEQRQEAIDTIRHEGVPARGTPERGLYMGLFVENPGRKPRQDGLKQFRYQPIQSLKAEDVAEIIRLYEDRTIPMMEIAAAYNIHRATLYRILEKHGVSQRSVRGGKMVSNVNDSGHFEPPVWVPGPVIPLVQQTPPAEGTSWLVEFTLRERQFIAAATLEEAITRFRERKGPAPVIIHVQQA